MKTIALSLLLLSSLLASNNFNTSTERYPIANMDNLSKADVGEQQIWDHALPFYAQQVIDKGFDLPFPYGVTILYYAQRQKLDLHELSIGVNGGSKTNIDKQISLNETYATNRTVQAKVDAWIFPFLNIYAVAGGIDGTAETELSLNFGEGEGDICEPGWTGKPSLACSLLNGRTIPINDIKYSGFSFGVGMVLAAGWEQWFVAIPMTYNWSWIDILSTTVGTINISPRTGYSFRLGEYGNIYPFIGGTYLDVDLTVEGSIAIDGKNELDYSLRQENSDKWNALTGFNLDFSKYWSWNLEAGFWGSRTNVITGITFRY